LQKTGSQGSFLGLAIIDATPTARATAFGLIGAMLCICAGTIVFAQQPGQQIHAIVPLLLGSVVVTELFSAFLLLGQFARIRLSSLLLIGMAYLFPGLVAIAYILTSPGIFGPNGVLHTSGQAALYLWIAWHGIFPLFVLTAIAFDTFARRPFSERVARIALYVAIVLCAAATMAAVIFLIQPRGHLPYLIVGWHVGNIVTNAVLPAICLVDCFAIGVIAFRTRVRSVVALWLLVAVVASLLDTVMGLVCARYSYGWYVGNILSLVSSSVILAAFVYELTALQVRLAALNDMLININEEDRRIARERLTFLAFHDHLTGLENRSRWQARLGERIAEGLEKDVQFSILFIDLDHFKEINDSAGHAMGDRVLVEAARRLKETLRSGDLIARFGGDEFVIMADPRTDADGVRTLAGRLRDKIRAPFVFDEQSFHITASVGVAIFPKDGSKSPTLLSHADAAAYQAKHAGGDCERFYTSEIGERLQQRRVVYEDLLRALKEKAFILHYQPLLDLRSNRVHTVEALVRWHRLNPRHLLPATFVPIAEESGLMRSIGRWILEEAIAQVRRWREDGHSLRVAVNISARQLQELDFFEHLITTLTAAHLEPDALEIEVTESAALTDPTMAQEQLRRCRGAGVRIALDDFGTHYSSLANLQRLPIDTIKIDRSFVKGIPFNTHDTAITCAIISLARDLGRMIVAEGVETAEQLAWLESAGCDVVQGFYIARPMPAKDLVTWLAPERSVALLRPGLAATRGLPGVQERTSENWLGMSQLTIEPNDALIVVDLQRDFLSGGALAVSEGDRVFQPINALAPRFARVYATRDWHPPDHSSFAQFGGPWPIHCVQESRGAELDERFDQMHIDRLVSKGVKREIDGYSGFAETDLAEDLRKHGVQRVFVCGLATDYCVKATALDAKANGFEVVVLRDASAAVNLERSDEERALDELRVAGVHVAESRDLIEPAA
jgi:diguanylate cyclase (GGDEF)-like protein